MRTKINAAVADVREEHNAKRLSWNMDYIQRLIRPYPINNQVDAALRKMEDDTWRLECERSYADEGEGAIDDSKDDGGFRRGTQRGGGGGGGGG